VLLREHPQIYVDGPSVPPDVEGTCVNHPRCTLVGWLRIFTPKLVQSECVFEFTCQIYAYLHAKLVDLVLNCVIPVMRIFA